MTMMRDIDAYLEHYGVKGQQWGVRKIRKTPAQKRAKQAGHLSDAELKKRVDRLNLERNYSQLTAPKQSIGKEIALNTLKQQGGMLAVMALKKSAPVLKKGAGIVAGLIAAKAMDMLVSNISFAP